MSRDTGVPRTTAQRRKKSAHIPQGGPISAEERNLSLALATDSNADAGRPYAAPRSKNSLTLLDIARLRGLADGRLIGKQKNVRQP
jgi:hypothetical protein